MAEEAIAASIVTILFSEEATGWAILTKVEEYFEVVYIVALHDVLALLVAGVIMLLWFTLPLLLLKLKKNACFTFLIIIIEWTLKFIG